MQSDFGKSFDVKPKIRQNFGNFCHLIEKSNDYMDRNDNELAVLHCEAAAAYAISNHCGLFSSPNLERLIRNLGCKIGQRPPRLRERPSGDLPVNVLHVCSHVMSIGGSSRLVWRWIHEDRGRCHSVVLTRQPACPIPDDLTEAVQGCGGSVYDLGRTGGGFLERARRLTEIGQQADLVVLHTERDVLPLIAFADRKSSPPMLFVDHGDHKFRLGLGSSSAVASLRESGMRLAQQRKDVCASRNVLLPTLIERVTRENSREAAKRSLGLPADCIMLLCVARRVKFKTAGDHSYADLHRPLLENDPRIVFIVLGAGDRTECMVRSDRIEDRMIFMRERADTATFYEGADIYIDSFPFVSITSLLEAGCRGVPLVSYFPHGEAAGIFGSDMPGLTGHLLRAVSLDDYRSMIADLLADEDYRRDLGDRTRVSIESLHMGASWQAALQHAYRTAMQGDGDSLSLGVEDAASFEEVDQLVPLVCAQGQSRDQAVQEQLRIYSPSRRLRQWLVLAREEGFYVFLRRGAIKGLLPEWLVHALRRLRRSYRERSLHRKQPHTLPTGR